MERHTPGPWYVTGSDPNGGMVFATNNTPVAAWPTHDDSGLQMANAKLIAAAPELLDSLQAVMLLLREGNPIDLVHDGAWIQGAIDKATV